MLQPQPLAGRENYAQNCAPCHGQTGKGDGPSSAGLGVPPTVFADYKVIAGLPPTELFNITKNGNMQRMMPPWKNRLNDQQIWDAVGYAWTLHTSAAEVALGQEIYAKQCASCHGPDGKGKPPMLDLTDFTKTSALSQNAWAQVLAKGRNTMPAFGDKLNETDQRARAGIHSQPFLRAALSRGLWRKEPVVISGTVTNQTTGQPLANSAVELGIFDDTTLLESRTATADATGFYRFTELPTDATLFYVARVTYGSAGTGYSSEPGQFSPSQTALNLPIAIYETTTDGSGVSADRFHLIVEFDSDTMLIAELMVFSLSGNRAYAGDGTGVLRFTLPAGAENLEISDGELGGRYIPTADGFVDSLPLPPGKKRAPGTLPLHDPLQPAPRLIWCASCLMRWLTSMLWSQMPAKRSPATNSKIKARGRRRMAITSVGRGRTSPQIRPLHCASAICRAASPARIRGRRMELPRRPVIAGFC